MARRVVIAIQVLTPDDWPRWRALRLAALTEAPYAFGSRLADWQGENDRPERWHARLSLAGSYNLIATLDAHPVGMVGGIAADEPGARELISMWVAPEGRGRGVGEQLIDAVEQWARADRATTLHLTVYDTNEHAKRLYQRCGFVPQTVADGELLMVKRW